MFNDLKDFATDCLSVHQYGSHEYRLAEFYLNNSSKDVVPVKNMGAMLNDWGRLGAINAELLDALKGSVEDQKQMLVSIGRKRSKDNPSWRVIEAYEAAIAKAEGK